MDKALATLHLLHERFYRGRPSKHSFGAKPSAILDQMIHGPGIRQKKFIVVDVGQVGTRIGPVVLQAVVLQVAIAPCIIMQITAQRTRHVIVLR